MASKTTKNYKKKSERICTQVRISMRSNKKCSPQGRIALQTNLQSQRYPEHKTAFAKPIKTSDHEYCAHMHMQRRRVPTTLSCRIVVYQYLLAKRPIDTGRATNN